MSNTDTDQQLTVDDLRPSDLMGEWENRVATDVEWLKQRRSEFVDVNCPACGSDIFEPLYIKNGVPHVCCKNCQTQYANPRPSERVLIDFYKRSSNYEYWAEKIYLATEETRRQKLFVPRINYVVERAKAAGLDRPVLMEVGAGYGIFCEEATKTDFFDQVIGIEPTPSLAEVCRRKGIDVRESSYEDLPADQTADIIASYEVIEHLQAPNKFMEFCYRTLRPGGMLVLTCPCISGFETQVQKHHSGTIDHQHVNLFSTQSLALLARNVGFEKIETETPGELDTELVIAALGRGEADIATLGTFLSDILSKADSTIIAAFQAFLKAAGASSHMRLVAHKAR